MVATQFPFDERVTMVGRRRKSFRKLAASPQRSWLWGRHAVTETLQAGRWRPLEVRFADSLDDATRGVVVGRCEELDVTYSEHPAEQLTRWCGTGEHQGLLAQMPPYPYLNLDAALTALRDPPLVLILDRIQDPHNFGAILRSADVFGVDVVIVGETSQCEVTPHVARSSAGGVNHVPIARTSDLSVLPALLLDRRSIRTLAAAGEAERAVGNTDLRSGTALVIGNEGEGIARELLNACQGQIRIPQSGRVESLNAAVAAGVLLYEVQRQRGSNR